MYAALSQLVETMESMEAFREVLYWASPVPYFGRMSESIIATVGINPSNREFLDADGCELVGGNRRLETLASLSLANWSSASGNDIRTIADSCESYFEHNPYRRWFDVLDRMLAPAGAGYYQQTSYNRACHIDLVPFATRDKWSTLPLLVRRTLLMRGRRTVAGLIRDSAVQVVILNGSTVVREFEQFAGVALKQSVVDDLALPRFDGQGVSGIVYFGTISSIDGIDLDREVVAFGFNHNLQSSFGVTSQVLDRVGARLEKVIGVALRD
jgi:hypothetical protein